VRIVDGCDEDFLPIYSYSYITSKSRVFVKTILVQHQKLSFLATNQYLEQNIMLKAVPELIQAAHRERGDNIITKALDVRT
jgi:hypothetical protein